MRFARTSILSQGERKRPPSHPSWIPARIGLRGRPSIAGIAMALRRPHEGMIRWGAPAAPPLDSRLRGNDEVGAGMMGWAMGEALWEEWP